MNRGDSEANQTLAREIVDVHFEIMNGKVGASHSHFEFRLFGGGEGGNFHYFAEDGTTSMDHPDFEGLDFGERVDKADPYSERILTLLEKAREQDRKTGVPVRNMYDMKVYRDGRHEFQFYHDADLAAEQLAKVEESERKEAIAKEKQDRERAQNPQLTEQVADPMDVDLSDRYDIKKEKIYRNEDNIWHAEEFLRYQAAQVAPEGWEEIRIEMIRESDNRTRMDQWYRLEGESEFQRLIGRSSMDVVDAIEHWRVRKDDGQHRERNVRFTLSPEDVEMHNAIRYEWDVGAEH